MLNAETLRKLEKITNRESKASLGSGMKMMTSLDLPKLRRSILSALGIHGEGKMLGLIRDAKTNPEIKEKFCFITTEPGGYSLAHLPRDLHGYRERIMAHTVSDSFWTETHDGKNRGVMDMLVVEYCIMNYVPVVFTVPLCAGEDLGRYIVDLYEQYHMVEGKTPLDDECLNTVYPLITYTTTPRQLGSPIVREHYK